MNKKLFLAGLCYVLGVSLFAQDYSGGTGSSLYPYQIANLADLQYLSEHESDWDKNFKQTANIDASASLTWNGGAGFSPIGNATTEFSGQYLGEDFAISGLSINTTNLSYVGLFGKVSDAYIMNLKLLDATVVVSSAEASDFYVGALVGSMTRGEIKYCYVDAEVELTTTSFDVSASLGGMVGNAESVILTEVGVSSASTVQLEFDSNASVGRAGGLIGFSFNGYVIDSYSRADVSTDNGVFSAPNASAGGLLGESSSYLMNCYAAGDVKVSTRGTKNEGGLVGKFTGTSVVSSYYDKNLCGLSDQVKGTPKTTAEMKTVSTYVDWEFGTKWFQDAGVNGGYPTFESVLTSVNEVAGQEPSVLIYPNPATDYILVEGAQGEAIRIFDMQGQTVIYIAEGSANQSVDLSNLVHGIYLVKVGELSSRLLVD